MTAAVVNKPESAPAGARQSAKGTWFYITAGILMSLVFLLPLLYAVVQSFLPASTFTSAPTLKDFTHLGLDNYRGLFSGDLHILQNVLNSLWVSLGAATLTAVLSLLAGYGFGRFRFPGIGYHLRTLPSRVDDPVPGGINTVVP